MNQPPPDELRAALAHPARLAALHESGLLDGGAEHAFDRLTRLACQVLKAPVALLSVVDEDRQFFKSCRGLPEPWNSCRQAPLSQTFCPHVVAEGRPLIINEVRGHPLARGNPAVTELSVEAYLGIPVMAASGHVLGSFCVMDRAPRTWTDPEVETLRELTALLTNEIELRHDIRVREWVEQRSRETEAHRGAILEAALDSIISVDPDGLITEWNPAAERMFGYSQAQAIGRRMAELIIPPSLRDRHHRSFRACLAGDEASVIGQRIEATGMRADGSEFPVELTVARIDVCTPPLLTAFIRDITDRWQAEAVLRDGEERLRRQNTVLVELARGKVHDLSDVCETMKMVTEAAADTLDVERTSVWLYNDEQSLIRCADLYERQAGTHTSGLELAAADYPTYFKALKEERIIAAGDARMDPRTAEFAPTYLGPFGISSMLDAPVRLGGRMVGVVCHEHIGEPRRWTLDEQNFARSMADLISLALETSERKRAEEMVRWQAFHDALTGLPNRVLFHDRLTQAIETAARKGGRGAVLFLDLDRFKRINDTLGHDAGDTLLRVVAKRLAHCLRTEDLIARLGGDEFTILLPSISGPKEAAAVAQRMLEALKQPVSLCGLELSLNASIGISFFPSDGRDAFALLKHSDLAMYQTKVQGCGGYQLYTQVMDSTASDRLLMETGLRKALELEELTLHYQPQVEMSTGQVIGVEALVRWQHPVHGLLLPSKFIPLAEETGLIFPMGEWVLRQACRQGAEWQAAGLPVRVAVNVSACQFRRPGLTELVRSVLEATGLAPHGLELELTETVLMENGPEVIETLHGLKELGVRLAVDDFGTGYSSLSYLRRLPLDILKVDHSFVHSVAEDSSDYAVVRALVQMAHALGLEVVAEGVETGAQRDCLVELGCNMMQGNYFSPALPLRQVEAMLAGSQESNPLNPVPTQITQELAGVSGQ